MNPLQILLGLVAFIIIARSSIVVMKQRPHSWTSRLVAMLGVVCVAYVITNYLSLNPPVADLDVQLFWIRVVMVVTTLICPLLLLLASTFPNSAFRLRLTYHVPIILLVVAAAAFISTTPLVFSGLQYVKGFASPVQGPAMVIWAISMIGFFAATATTSYRQRDNMMARTSWTPLTASINPWSPISLIKLRL